MGLYQYNNRETYLVHIPRTGGRYVDQIIKESGALHSYTDMNQQILSRFVCHLHYPLYEYKLPTTNATHIAVVREPLDRFKSVMNQKSLMFDIDYNKEIRSKEDWDRFLLISQEIDDFRSNWMRPQNEFVCERTLIWKYEDGFGDDFIKWLYNMTGIEAAASQRSYLLLPSEETDQSSIELNDQICDWAKEFYTKDYDKFEY